MNETMSAAGYQYPSSHSMEKEHHQSALHFNADPYQDSDSEIASQILASFRNSMFQKKREVTVKREAVDQEALQDIDNHIHKVVCNLGNLPDKMVKNLDNTIPQKMVPGLNSPTPEKQEKITTSDRIFGDLPFTQSITADIPSHSHTIPDKCISVIEDEIKRSHDLYHRRFSANDIEVNRSHDLYKRQLSVNDIKPFESHDNVSDIQYSLDTSQLVSSTNNDGDNMLNGNFTNLSCVSKTQKSKDKGQQKKDHELPPCRVCGYKASGFHYGANTCEACKGFFRRSLKKDISEYKCIIGDNKCVIQKGRRNNCPLCRYNRCLSVGMSKDAIKTGRYTHEKRTQDIIEVKGLKGDTLAPLTNVSHIKPFGNIKIKEERVLGEEQLGLIDRIYSAHKVLFPLWHKVLDSGKLPALAKVHFEKFTIKKLTQGASFYRVQEECNETDEEDRMKTMDVLTKHLEIAIMTFVKFAKSIPGFCKLPLNDQAALVKSSRFEVWMIGAYKFIDVEYQVIVGPRGNSFHIEELKDVLEEEFVEKMFEFSSVLQQIGLKNEELSLMKCIVLTFSDRCDLEAPDKVDEIQWNLVNCLQAQLNSSQRFTRVMNAFVTLRDLTEMNKRISENLVLEWPTIKHNPLLMEVMNI